MMTLKRQIDVTPRASKRLKTKARKDEAVTISSTLFGCTDIVAELFSFLDTNSLLQFSCVNKDFSSLLTYNHVVRATMMSGGYAATTLERMIPPIRDQMIWIPSPMRLLRVVSGKRCERCHRATRYVSPCIGMFLCTRCTGACSEKTLRKNPVKRFLDCKRVQRVPLKGPRSPHRFLIKAPIQDSTGTNIGPVVTLQDIETMATITNMTQAEKVVARHVEECDTRQPKAIASANAILSAVNQNREDATARKNAILKAKLEGQKRFEEARKKRVDALLFELKALLGENVSWKSNLDNRRWKSNGNQYLFSDPILQGILQPMLKAPSKINKKVLGEIPGRIQATVDKRALMDLYIERILHFVGDDDGERALQHGWNTEGFHYNFYNRSIGKLLAQPLKDPYALSEGDLQKLCEQVKAIVNRKHTGRVVLQKLASKLEGCPFQDDVQQYHWIIHLWAYGFRNMHVQRILREPLLAPEEITEEKLNAIAEQLRMVLEKKQEAFRKVNLLLEPTRDYPEWTGRLNSWFWNSRDNKVIFHNFAAREILNPKFADLDNLTDETIVGLSKEVIKHFEKKYGNAES
ncbi:unnamed protein product [Cylindrotheca closterium]|uniref:F-box domain-containing protein n=1 Tax=Cylindrotheca closterium TaxID=2856 RepID=A0AAD2GBC0_9STRA|nr:unnamed protein product [Cylindrotheca closterium]